MARQDQRRTTDPEASFRAWLAKQKRPFGPKDPTFGPWLKAQARRRGAPDAPGCP
jgi:hypothetical protein